MAFIIWVGYVISSLSDISQIQCTYQWFNYEDFSFRSIVQSSYMLKLNEAFSDSSTFSKSGLVVKFFCINRQFYSSKKLFSSQTVLHSLKTSVHVF